MKKATLIIISFLVASNIVWAQKAPDGFLGIKWGTTLEEFKKTAIFTECSIKQYGDTYLAGNTFFSACGEWEKIGDAPVTKYHFVFSKSDSQAFESSHLSRDEFYLAFVQFPKSSSFDVFLKALTEKYGKPKAAEPLVLKINPNAKVGMAYMWAVENKVIIDLRYDDMKEAGINGTLSYTYIPILDQINKPKDVKKTKDKL
jgi:hypothetical protein